MTVAIPWDLNCFKRWLTPLSLTSLNRQHSTSQSLAIVAQQHAVTSDPTDLDGIEVFQPLSVIAKSESALDLKGSAGNGDM